MSDPQSAVTNQANQVSALAQQLSEQANRLANDVNSISYTMGHNADFLMMGLTIFVLACFVGYYVVWRVTPALHSPLMAITNAISSVIIVGALIAAGPAETSFSKLVGFLAVILVSINIFGGFIVTRRMLHMFKKKV
ncbi:MAG TPA: NAD(P) transhydrogenase subunit alpha [Alphaproteobacteria bacterium]|nr:NAD(P) transhydrogenase subunit alpha [Alphaproteobacteria bacterium]HOO49768.1 NAD(P) transhydrogenase subunit alpha [Alphaproteobacteria bacterium]